MYSIIRVDKIVCGNGDCVEDGCECHYCWSGTNCLTQGECRLLFITHHQLFYIIKLHFVSYWPRHSVSGLKQLVYETVIYHTFSIIGFNI